MLRNTLLLCLSDDCFIFSFVAWFSLSVVLFFLIWVNLVCRRAQEKYATVLHEYEQTQRQLQAQLVQVAVISVVSLM